jgi:hypothetical protein
MLKDEDAIDDINPFVSREFSLPGGVGQTGDFADFSVTRDEPGIPEPTRSVFCDYSLCKEGADECPLSRPLHPRRNIDTGLSKKDRTYQICRCRCRKQASVFTHWCDRFSFWLFS